MAAGVRLPAGTCSKWARMAPGVGTRPRHCLCTAVQKAWASVSVMLRKAAMRDMVDIGVPLYRSGLLCLPGWRVGGRRRRWLCRCSIFLPCEVGVPQKLDEAFELLALVQGEEVLGLEV
jgi:hypothetical protein